MIKLPSYCFSCTTKYDVVNYLSRDKTFVGSVRESIKKNFTEDLLQDLYVYFLELEEEKIMYLNNEGTIIFYAYGILRNRLENINTYKNYRSMDGGENLAEYFMEKAE